MEKGGAEKARIKKKQILEGDASKCSKITDSFGSQASTSRAGELTEKKVSQSSIIDVIARRELAQASQMCMCWYISDELMTFEQLNIN